ncbi:MAG: glycoside hydrolase family 2 TIM barrel-domain containing protein [Solirubrobacteraceae bacterium]
MTFSRRAVLRAAVAGAVGASAFGFQPASLGAATARRRALKTRRPRIRRSTTASTYDFNQGWRFGGRYTTGAEKLRHADARYARVNVPHTVTPLSWGDWDPSDWEHTWIYRKHFSGADLGRGRVFVDFDGVMTNATVYLNGVKLAEHDGGYLPFSVELTEHLVAGHNVLAVIVDAKWVDVPPSGHPGGAASIDYLQPGGIYRDVALRVVPDVFISDVFAKPIDVLTATPTVAVAVTLQAQAASRHAFDVTAELLDGTTLIATAPATVSLKKGRKVVRLTIADIGAIELWSPDTPKLYTVRVTLTGPSTTPSHTFEVTIGFREATFEPDGFFLNGQRLQIFGVNRHQLFPYTGMASPRRVQERDAELLKSELNCNMVRCSHYPQSPHFLDACDRLGLMVWEEAPGWKFVGNAHFQKCFIQNVHDMVVRDRNRPSVIAWGTRLDETADHPVLYARARALAYDLDGSRPTTGAMHTHSTSDWAEDVFAYDDYHFVEGQATLEPPLPGVPYMVSEAVGALDGVPMYRWVDSSQALAMQAANHAEVHNIARSDPGYAGLLAWCGIDYASLNGRGRVWNGLKWAGVLDTFRVPKPGAAFYRAQQDPSVAPVIVPAFFWDFGPASPPTGPGPESMLATNCDRLEIHVPGQLLTEVTPDAADLGALAHPPVMVDLLVDGTSLPDLIVAGYVGDQIVTTLQMSSDTTLDRLVLELDDVSIAGDGSDATRFTLRALDAYGNQRPYVAGDVILSISGPGVLVCQNPFPFASYGGVGGGFIRSEVGGTGVVTLTASHPTLGEAQASLDVTPPTGEYL